MRLHLVRRSAAAAGVAVALLCVLVGCGTSSTPTSSTPNQTSPPAMTTAAPTTAASTTATASAAACADVAELKSSLEALTKVKPAEDGVPALKTAIANVKTNLAPAQASASEALQPSVEQVKTAFADLQTAARRSDQGQPQRKGARHRRRDETAARTATAALSSTLTESCPGS